MDAFDQIAYRFALVDQNRHALNRRAGLGPHGAHAEDAHFVVVGHDELEKAVAIAHRNRAVDVLESDARHAVFNAGLLGLGLVHAHTRHFGVQEHNGRDIVVAHVCRLAVELLYDMAPLHFANVHQTDVKCEIANGKNIVDAGLPLFVGDDMPTVAQFNAGLFEPHMLSIGHPANGHESDFGEMRGAGAVFFAENIFDAPVFNGHRLQVGLSMNMDAIFFQILCSHGRHVFVLEGQNTIGAINHIDIGLPERRKHSRVFATNDPRPQHDHALGKMVKVVQTIARDDRLLVDGNAIEFAGAAAHGQNDIIGGDRTRATFIQVNGNRMRVFELSIAGYELEVAFGDLGVMFNLLFELRLAFAHSLFDDMHNVFVFNSTRMHAKTAVSQRRTAKVARELPEGFGGQGSIVNAGTAQAVALNQRNAFAIIQGMKGGCKSCRAATNHNDVEISGACIHEARGLSFCSLHKHETTSNNGTAYAASFPNLCCLQTTKRMLQHKLMKIALQPRWAVLCVLGLFILCFADTLQAQDISREARKTERKALKEADDYLNYNDSRNAIPHLEEARGANPYNMETTYLLGRSYMHIGRKDKALPLLEEVSEKEPGINDAFKHIYAQALHANMKLDAAEQMYSQYLSQVKPGSDEAKAVKLSIRHVKNARELIQKPVEVKIENAGPQINSPFPDYVPVITADNQTMIFTSRRQTNMGDIDYDGFKYEDLYTAQRKTDGWSNAQPLGEPVNSKYHDASASISADGQTLYIYRSGKRSVYKCKRKGDQWSKPKDLDNISTRRNWEPHAAQSADGQWLFFVSDRDGGQGGLDLWMSKKTSDGEWGEPNNLGSTVNTEYEERAPFFHPDGRTLYFSSEGHNAMGGLDIFKTTLTDGQWSKPVNIGYPVNTTDDDVYFVMAADGRTAYYASSKPGGYGEKDIYSIRFLPKSMDVVATVKEQAKASTDMRLVLPEVSVTVLKGIITDADTEDPIEAKIVITDNQTGEEVATNVSDIEDGRYLVTLPAGKDYGIAVVAEGYLFHSVNVNIPETTGYQEIRKDIQLQRLEVGKKIILKNIFYDFDKATLRDESITELERLKTILNDYPKMKIRIGGHTDSRGSDAYNVDLSDRRAKSVVEYLIDNGVDQARLEWKGYGEKEPIDTNDTDAGRQNNRRTEFEITAF